MALKKSAARYKKKQKNFLLPDHELAENLILKFGLHERTKEDKSEFVTKSVGNVITIIFK